MLSLLAKIDVFMTAHSLSASRFGLLAVNDKHLVRQMRDEGRRLWPETEAKVEQFMLSYAPDRETQC